MTRRRGRKDTDWAQIAALYGLLMRMSRNPMAV
jgi:predicted RNA polymerase sigma factor